MLRTKEHFAYEKLTKPPQFETQKQYSACGFFENGSKWEFSEMGKGWRGRRANWLRLATDTKGEKQLYKIYVSVRMFIAYILRSV